MLSINRELLWIAFVLLDADCNLVSLHVERGLVSQYAPAHAHQCIGKGDGCLIAMHAFGKRVRAIHQN